MAAPVGCVGSGSSRVKRPFSTVATVPQRAMQRPQNPCTRRASWALAAMLHLRLWKQGYHRPRSCASTKCDRFATRLVVKTQLERLTDAIGRIRLRLASLRRASKAREGLFDAGSTG